LGINKRGPFFQTHGYSNGIPLGQNFKGTFVSCNAWLGMKRPGILKELIVELFYFLLLPVLLHLLVGFLPLLYFQ